MSQNSTVITTTGPLPGLTLVNAINSALDTIISRHSGSSAPGTPTTHQIWVDTSTTPPVVKQYDGTDWIPLFAVDATNNVVVPPIGGGSVPTISSASTTDLGSVNQGYKIVSGTTSITSFGSSAKLGTIHVVRFSGALTLTHNGTSLILPGSANITTVAGDVLIAVYEGSSNWRVVSYQRGDGGELKAFTGDSGSGGVKGLVPAPSAGDAAAGKILRADGTWGAPPSGMVLIKSQVASNSATIDFVNGVSGVVLDDTYDDYVVMVSSVVPATNGAQFQMLVGTGGAPTYQTANYTDNGFTAQNANAVANGVGTNSAAAMNLSLGGGNGVSNTATHGGLKGRIEFSNPEASVQPLFIYQVGYMNSSTNSVGMGGQAGYSSATAMTALRFQFASGNIASGRFSLYGLTKS